MAKDIEFYEPDTPPHLKKSRREVNLLWYGPSRLIAARTHQGDIAAIRFAVRQDQPVDGLITDLVVEDASRQPGLASDLIARAESALTESGVERVEAVALDGQGLTTPFLEAGYRPFRKTVVLGWDLGKLKEIRPPTDIEAQMVERIDPTEIAEFIFVSYQPYWQWWKETGKEVAVGRAEYPVKEPSEVLARQRQANWDQVIEQLKDFNTTTAQRMVIARRAGSIIGLCDVKADASDSMDWGVLIHRDSHSRQLGSALLKPALDWLRQRVLKTAQVTTTSGLDDYDPVVYLYVLVSGAQIKGEFLILRRTTLGDYTPYSAELGV